MREYGDPAGSIVPVPELARISKIVQILAQELDHRKQIKVKQKRIVHQNKTNSRMKGGDPLAIHYETKFQNHFLFRETTQTKTKSRFTLLSSFIQHCLIPTNPKSKINVEKRTNQKNEKDGVG